MNKIIKSVLIGLAFLPSLTLAVTAVGWNTPTPTTGWVLPNAINGTNQVIYAINGIFSTASSTFSSSFRLPSLSNGGLAVFNGLVSSGATTTAGTGLSYSGNAFNVNASQNISTLSNLTSNGAILTSGGTGALSIYSGTSCTNQFVRSLSGSIVATCATVANTDLANSSITINGSSVSLGGSITVASTTLLSDLNNWTKRQDFSNSSTSLGSFNYSSSTNLFAGSITLATTTAGTVKTTSGGLFYIDTSAGGSGTPAGSNGQLQYNASGAFGGVSTTTASCTGSVSCTGFTIIGSSPITITGSGGSGGGLGTSTPWTYGNIVTAITDGNVTTISTSTLVNNIFPFNSFGNSTSSIFNFTNGLMAFSSTTLNGLKLSDLSQGALYVGSGAKVNSVATSTQTVGSSLSYTGTQGSMLGGSSGTLSLNTANPNTWSVLQTFNYSSSTAYSSFQNSSSTFSTIGTLTLSTTTAGTLKTNSSGLVWADTSGGGGGVTSVTATYPIISSGGATPAISIAFSTTTANIWSALNTFNGGLTIGTTTAGILRTNSSGVVYASSATTTLPLLNAFSLPSNDSSYFSSTLVDFPTSISSQSIFVASSTTVQTGVMGAIHIPENFASSTAQVEIGWTATSTTGNIVARFQYVCTGGSNTTTYVKTAWAESTSTTVANPSTAGFKVETTLNINAGYYCSAGNTMQFYLSRDGSDSADTSVVPMEIYDTTINLLTQ